MRTRRTISIRYREREKEYFVLLYILGHAKWYTATTSITNPSGGAKDMSVIRTVDDIKGTTLKPLLCHLR